MGSFGLIYQSPFSTAAPFRGQITWNLSDIRVSIRCAAVKNSVRVDEHFSIFVAVLSHNSAGKSFEVRLGFLQQAASSLRIAPVPQLLPRKRQHTHKKKRKGCSRSS